MKVISMARTVSDLLHSAFLESMASSYERRSDWIAISHRLGGALPRSLLSASIQRCGNIDGLILSVEGDVIGSDYKIYDTNLLLCEIQVMLSEIWVCELYEILRLCKDRDIISNLDGFDDLYWKITMLRMVFEKHEIAKDRKMKKDINFYSGGNLSSPVVYSRKDPLKAHIMSKGPSSRGSMTWNAFDATTNKEVWIERRTLSDEFLSVFALPKPLS